MLPDLCYIRFMNRTEQETLTPREWEVLALVREGLTNEQIAERLGISRDGAKYHVSDTGKLGLSGRIEAAAWYSRNRPLVQRYAILAWPAALLGCLRLPSAIKLSASAVIGTGVLFLVALLAGVLIDGIRSNDDTAAAVAPTVAPTKTPTTDPSQPGFAPDGRTGDADLDHVIQDFVTLTGADFLVHLR